jgi:hypothetical protein
MYLTPQSEPLLVRHIGAKREFDFEPRDHEEVGEPHISHLTPHTSHLTPHTSHAMQLLRMHRGANFEAAAAAVGARFTSPPPPPPTYLMLRILIFLHARRLNCDPFASYLMNNIALLEVALVRHTP